jgi:hypothetical protein
MTEGERKKFDSARWMLVFLILAVSAGSLMYKFTVRERLEQTSLLFVGIPAMLAIILALTPKAKTALGAIVKGLTVALLLSAPLLGEGFICIVMASPIFYGVGILIGVLVDKSRKRKQTTLSCLLLVIIPMSIEGSSPKLSFNREETVQASKVINSPAEQVELVIARSPRTGLPLPLYLRMGFPRPTDAQGEGLQVGNSRTIHFAGGEGRPGDLVLQVEESRPGYLRFRAISDRSKIAHWLDWKSSEVEWMKLDSDHTRVTWKLHFQRRLDPAWYFRPWERYAARLAAEYLIEANAIPEGSRAN